MSSLFAAAAASRPPLPESSNSGDIIDQQLFAKSGTAALSHEQRLARAKRKGLCARCGIQTHNLKVSKITRRSSSSTPVTDEDVHDGHCILCDPDMVPMEVLIAWEERHPERIVWAKCTNQHTHRGIYRKQQQQQQQQSGGNLQEQLRQQNLMPSSSAHSGISNNNNNNLKNISGRTGKTERGSASSSHNEDPSQPHHQETSMPPIEELLVGKTPGAVVATSTTANNSMEVSQKSTNNIMDASQKSTDILNVSQTSTKNMDVSQKSSVSQKSAASTDDQDRCSKCGIQTHEKIKVKLSSGFMKRKSKKELRPLTLEGAVLAGRCLLCFPLPESSTTTQGNSISGVQSQSQASNAGKGSILTDAIPKGDFITNNNGADNMKQPQARVKELLEQVAKDDKGMAQESPAGDFPPWSEQDADADEVGSDIANGQQSETSEPVMAQAPDDAPAVESPSFAGGIPTCISVQPSLNGEESGHPGEPTTLPPPQNLGGPLMAPPEQEAAWSMPWPLNKPAEDNEDESSTDEETHKDGLSLHSSSAFDRSSQHQSEQGLRRSTSSSGRPPLHASDSWGRISCSSRQIDESGYSFASTRMSTTNHDMDESGNSFAGSRMSGTSRRMDGSGNSFASSRLTNSSRMLEGSRRTSYTGGRRSSSRQMINSSHSYCTNNSNTKHMNRACTMPIPDHLDFDESNQDGMSLSKASQAGDASSTGNTFIVDMLAASDAASWLRKLATEVRDNDDFRAEAAEGGCIVAVITAMRSNKTEGLVQQQGCVALHAFAREHGATIARHGGTLALTSAMKHHGEQDPILQEHAAGALVYVVVNDGYKVAVAKRGGIPCILAAMRRYVDNVGLQKRSCMALLKLSSHRDVIDSLASPKHRGVHIVVESMVRHKADLAVSQYASGILKNVAQKDGAGSLIVQEDGVAALLGAMKRHKENVILNQQAAWALCEISASENIAKQGTIKYTIGAMRAHKSEESIQQYACGVLANLSITKDNIYAVAKLKGISPLLDAMEDHKDNAALQRYACRTLKHLSLSGTNERAIGKKGGLKVLFATMKVHHLDGTVQREAIGALRNLTLSDDNKGQMKKDNIEAIFDAIGNSIYDTGLQEKAAGALLNLSSSSAVRKLIGSEEAKNLVAMMRQQSSSAKVQELLCGTLKNLTIGTELKKVIGQSEGINTILAAMKRHNGSTKLLSYALGALKNLSGNAENRQEIGKQQGIIAVLSIMKQHLSVETVQQEANGVLLNLSILKENSESIGKHGGILAIITAMKHHPTNPCVQSSAFAALWNLSIVPDNQKLIFNDSGISCIITGLEYHVSDKAVCHKACLALANMAVSDTYRTSISECGGVDAVSGAMSCHIKDASCQKYACKFLVSMLGGGAVYQNEVRKSITAVKEALKQHPTNADLKVYADRILSDLSTVEHEAAPTESAPAESAPIEATPAEGSMLVEPATAESASGAVASIEC